MNITRVELMERFTWIDYSIFVVMLGLSAAIGIFYGCFRKTKTTQDFLMAGRSMTTFPVALSLIASFMSAITLLGNPSEVYLTGFVYWWIGISYILVMLASAHFFLPVFWELQVTSAYEYLEKRFHVSVRRISSLLFVFQMSLYMAIVVYAPSLALSQVTGINVYVSVSAICFVCMFYTAIGGMKAVLWTDTLQVLIMYGCILFICIKGALNEGGFAAVWEAGNRGNRTEMFIFDLSPTTRHTFWTLSFGGYFLWITIYGFNQTMVQRYMCVKEQKMAVRALYINIIGLLILMTTCSFAGLVIYKRYEHCDPLTAGIVNTDDQILPLFVMDALGHMRGLPGLFVAGTFAGALSTVSSGMNSLAAITLEDFLKGCCWPNLSEKTATNISKLLSLFFGLLTFGLVFVAERLGNILSAALSLFGVVGGPVMGAFTLGMLFPWANATGAFIGIIAALGITLWINVGFQLAVMSKRFIPMRLPVQTDECFNDTFAEVSQLETLMHIGSESEVLEVYKLSYLHYGTVACFTVIIVGMIVSAITGFRDIRTVNPKLISPLFHWFKRWIPGGSQLGVDYKDESIKQDGDVKNKSFIQVNNPAFVPPEIKIEDYDTGRGDKLRQRDISYEQYNDPNNLQVNLAGSGYI